MAPCCPSNAVSDEMPRVGLAQVGHDLSCQSFAKTKVLANELKARTRNNFGCFVAQTSFGTPLCVCSRPFRPPTAGKCRCAANSSPLPLAKSKSQRTRSRDPHQGPGRLREGSRHSEQDCSPAREGSHGKLLPRMQNQPGLATVFLRA